MSILNSEIVIIGAGMSGLSAAKSLLEAGRKVTVIEARERPGGRINTLEYQFSQAIDAGAEFIHGDLPLTKKLAKTSNASYHTKKGKIYKGENGAISEVHEMIDDYKKVVNRLNELSSDMPLSEFIDLHLSGPGDVKAKRSVRRMAEGFDVADVGKISAFAVRDEWTEDTISDPYILDPGYAPLVKHLFQECLALGCQMHLSSPVKRISWGKNSVTVHSTQLELRGKKLIVSLPIGVLTATPGDANFVRFEPALAKQINSAKQIGFGSVVKAIFEFSHCFWDDHNFKDKIPQLPKLGFLITDTVFPTWWTHEPNLPVLTAWAGGPNADRLKGKEPDLIAEQALRILADIFSIDLTFLNSLLVSHKVIDWGSDPYSKGAYSYDTLRSKQARETLLRPVDNTIYFCGEALGDNGVSGTVEAAIASGLAVAKQIRENKS